MRGRERAHQGPWDRFRRAASLSSPRIRKKEKEKGALSGLQRAGAVCNVQSDPAYISLSLSLSGDADSCEGLKIQDRHYSPVRPRVRRRNCALSQPWEEFARDRETFSPPSIFFSVSTFFLLHPLFTFLFFSSTCFFLSHFFLPFLSHLSRLLLLLLLVSLLLVVLVLLLLLLEKKKKRRKVCSFSGFLFSSKRARTFFCNRKRSVEGARRELRNLWESSK